MEMKTPALFLMDTAKVSIQTRKDSLRKSPEVTCPLQAAQENGRQDGGGESCVLWQ
jgi:hypothetical protein